jgi:L-ribulose-5-phosphate 3-epimerase
MGGTTRRDFLGHVPVVAAAGVALAATHGAPTVAVASTAGMAPEFELPEGRTIYRTLKWGMINLPGSATLTERFEAARDAGFDGVEVDLPDGDVPAILAASQAARLPVDGSVCKTHWTIRHTSPDAEQRAQALEDLKGAIRQTHQLGGHSVLLVAGHGQDGPEAELIERSIENISKALPLAAWYGVHILIENVWNHFLYDHGGDANQSAKPLADYVDAFHSPWVGVHFDLGNHWKYGDVAQWTRELGKRIVKLDIKGFSRETGNFTKITEGDIDWPSVQQALADVGFVGWCAAEVGGGGPERLREIVANMNRALGLS